MPSYSEGTAEYWGIAANPEEMTDEDVGRVLIILHERLHRGIGKVVGTGFSDEHIKAALNRAITKFCRSRN